MTTFHDATSSELQNPGLVSASGLETSPEVGRWRAVSRRGWGVPISARHRLPRGFRLGDSHQRVGVNREQIRWLRWAVSGWQLAAIDGRYPCMRLVGGKVSLSSVVSRVPELRSAAAMVDASSTSAFTSRWQPLIASAVKPTTLQAMVDLVGPRAESTSAEWKRVSVRDPSQPMLDEAYLQRAHDSVTQVFGPWLRGTNDQSFETMLRAQHTVLVSGLDGLAHYAGASRAEQNQATGYRVAPGKLMTEVFPPSGEVKFAFHRPTLLQGAESPLLTALAAAYPASETLGREFIGKTPDGIHSPFAATYQLTLPRVAASVRATNEVVGDYLTHTYPRVGDLPHILTAMAEVMGEVRALRATGQAAPKALIHLLGEYTYLAANAHFATGANFSLAMSQVNHVLEAFGLRGISHGNLDYVAISHSFESFLGRFGTDIAKENPRLKPNDLPQPVRSNLSPVPLRALGHFAFEGDASFEGTLASSGHRTSRLEGLQIDPSLLPPGVQLELKARLENGTETEWVGAGTFVGSRGESRALTALGVRLTGPEAHRYETVLQTRNAGAFTTPVSSGLMSGDGSQALTGFKLALHRYER